MLLLLLLVNVELAVLALLPEAVGVDVIAAVPLLVAVLVGSAVLVRLGMLVRDGVLLMVAVFVMLAVDVLVMLLLLAAVWDGVAAEEPVPEAVAAAEELVVEVGDAVAVAEVRLE